MAEPAAASFEATFAWAGGVEAILTNRRGRPFEVRVSLTTAQVAQAYEWAVAKRVVLVDGEVEAGSGRLIIRGPTCVQSLDETLFPDAD